MPAGVALWAVALVGAWRVDALALVVADGRRGGGGGGALVRVVLTVLALPAGRARARVGTAGLDRARAAVGTRVGDAAVHLLTVRACVVRGGGVGIRVNSNKNLSQTQTWQNYPVTADLRTSV